LLIGLPDLSHTRQEHGDTILINLGTLTVVMVYQRRRGTLSEMQFVQGHLVR
jgi:hypothetical protein